MNRSYLSYFRSRNPFKFISNIFRNYKKSPDSVKRNQSEPTVAQQQHQPSSLEDLANSSKSETNLCSCEAIEQWNNSKYEDSDSQDDGAVKLNRASSNISLKKTNCQLDLNIQEKLNHIPIQETVKMPVKIPPKRAYPWQNFNLANARKPRYDDVKEIGDMRQEIINLRKSILRKPYDRDTSSPSKEVKFNTTASMMFYPKPDYNIMRQARINLSTNVEKSSAIVTCRKKKLPVANKAKTCPGGYKKGVKRLRKCLPAENAAHFWYMNNAKKQKIF